MRSALKNERGQAAIFVALMFNVLFVFFAMSINVAMVIHDKINLQNSVDLGAYYAAAKQAELLNAMAHQNYAIRQSWKLLVWRYRVLGTMGLDRSGQVHPIRPGAPNNLSDTAFEPARAPAFCIMYVDTWPDDVPPNENLCNRINLKIPALPEVKVIAGFLGINYGIAALSRQLRQQFNQQCEKHGAVNWWFGASILHAFRLDQRNRKQVIEALARSMAASPGDFTDLDGNSVLEGVRNTILKNLTYANRQNVPNIELFNSMANVPVQNWLSEIKIAPTIGYTDIRGDTAACEAKPNLIENLPEKAEAREFLLQPFPTGLGASDLAPWFTEGGGFIPNSDFQYSLGYEKNPWVMPYVGVKAETAPRQVFYPTAGALPMVARAFAKPFGGRMGPWNRSTWDRGAMQSSGTEIDELLPPRVTPVGGMPDASDTRRLPNYSRYPGDRLGLISNLAQNGLTGLANLKAQFNDYKNIKAEIQIGGANDILAWDGVNQRAPRIREFELAAISPDLFDITYYSIEPNFTNNYWEKLNANRARLGIPGNVPVRPDLGHNSNVVPTYSVQQQMTAGRTLHRSQAFYFVRDKTHLLTSWAPGEANYNYVASEGTKFLGKCAVTDDNFNTKVPGSCAAGGGRTGYSVKLVSRNFLNSNQIPAGGPQASPNAIMNPPPAGF